MTEDWRADCSVSCNQGNHSWCRNAVCGCHCHRQGTLFDDADPPHARATDPDTSHEAAEKLTPKMEMKRRLLAAFADGRHLTAEEAAQLAGYRPEHGAWKRVSDLISAGLLEDTGKRRVGRSGRLQRVLRAVP